jgi:hypothetical protein
MPAELIRGPQYWPHAGKSSGSQFLDQSLDSESRHQVAGDENAASSDGAGVENVCRTSSATSNQLAQPPCDLRNVGWRPAHILAGTPDALPYYMAPQQ